MDRRAEGIFRGWRDLRNLGTEGNSWRPRTSRVLEKYNLIKDIGLAKGGTGMPIEKGLETETSDHLLLH